MKIDRIITCKRLASVLALAALVDSTQAATLHVPGVYATIQAAADAAASSGDEILIAPGVYQQQAFITEKKLTLTGSAGTILEAWTGMYSKPEGPSYTVVEVRTNADVVIRNIEFDGKRLAASMPNQNALLQAVIFLAASGRVENCVVRGFRGVNNLANPTIEPLGGMGFGFVAFNPLPTGSGVVHVQVLNSSFSDNGISLTFAGDFGPNPNPALLRTTFVAEGNTVAGIGPTDLGDQLGFQVLGGASGVIKNNRIIEHYHNNTAPWSWGIGAGDPPYVLQPIRIEGNTFDGNEAHVALILGDHSELINNVFWGSNTGSNCKGVYLTGSDIRLAINQFTNLSSGIVLADENSDPENVLPPGSGRAINPSVLANRFSCDVWTPLDVRPGVTGLNEVGTEFCPSIAPGNLTCSPGSGLPGITVALSGTNLAGATVVLFNGLNAEYTPGTDPDKEILATVPAHATTGPVTVITSLGNITSLTPFTVPVPLAMSLQPGGLVQLSWCADACDLVLESTSDLIAPDWQAVPTSPSVGTDSVTWTGTMRNGAQFFRLRQPCGLAEP